MASRGWPCRVPPTPSPSPPRARARGRRGVAQHFWSVGREYSKALRHHGGRLDLQARARLHQAAPLPHRHGGKMLAKNLAVGAAELTQARAVFVEIDHIPGEADEMLRACAAFGQDRDDIGEGLPRLRD